MKTSRKYIIVLFLVILSITRINAQCQAGFAHIQDSTGLITFIDTSVSSGTIISWFWDFGDGSSSTLQNATHQFNTNAWFVVCLIISDSDSCISTFCDSIFVGFIDPCSNFLLTYVLENESMPEASDGAIDITVSGGTPPYNYTWNIGPSIIDPINLASGTYCLTVTSSDPCLLDTCIYVGVDTIIDPCIGFSIDNINVTNETQTGAYDGSVSISVVGGTPPFAYIWSNGENGNPIDSLSAGLYCVTIISSDSCSIDTCITVGVDTIINTYVLAGEVYTNSGVLPSGTAKLYTSTDSLTVVYTTTIDNGFYLFNDVTSGSYKLLAVPDLPESNDYASTYFGNEYFFNDSYSLNIIANTYSVDITLQSTLGISSLNISNTIYTYPNPANNVIYIDASNIEKYSFSIINNLGQNIKSGKTDDSYIDINTLPNGVYTLIINADNRLYSTKFVKLKI